MKLALWILAALVLACSVGCDSVVPTTSNQSGEGIAAFAFAAVTEVESAPAPDSNVCSNCDGRGWIGDGVTKKTCQTCKGTGKPTTASAPVAAPQIQIKPKLEVYLRGGSEDCAKWMDDQAAIWIAKGWEVALIKDESDQPVPWFRVSDGTIRQKFLKGLTMANYQAWKLKKVSK